MKSAKNFRYFLTRVERGLVGRSTALLSLSKNLLTRRRLREFVFFFGALPAAVLLLFSPGALFAQASVGYNYVLASTVKQSGVTTEAGVNALTVSAQGRSETVQYFDGLGRPLQTVGVHQSAGQKDVVTPAVYDAYGREVKKYLPYSDQRGGTDGSFREMALVDEPNYYLSTALAGVDNDRSPWSVAVLENSPESRVLAQGAPGATWQPNTDNPYDASTHVLQFQYLVNKAEDNVRVFSVDSAGNITSAGYYGAGQLTEKVTSDEQYHVTKEFTDKLGHVVARRVIVETDSLQTYYLYDNLNLLRGVIQPEGTAQLQAAGWAMPAGFQQKWMFLYRYDQRNRMVMKEVPGADSVSLVYDPWDRLVLTQDGNLRSAHAFLFTKYDQLNRPVVTGQYTDSRSLATIVADVAAQTGRYETVSTGATEGYTLSASYPSSSSYTLTVLTTTHYDGYGNLPTAWASGYAFVSEYGVAAQNAFVTGQVVATQTRVLGTSTFLRAVTYYDDRYRAIQTTSDNYAGGKDRLTKVLTFDGKVASDYHAHTSRFYTTALTIKQTYGYDHADRLTSQTHQVGSQEVTTTSQPAYNELGQLLQKKLHQSASHPAALQTEDFYYNIRGWLSRINEPNYSFSDYDEKDLFSETLDYVSSFTPIAPYQYSGNISQVQWKGGYDEYNRGFGYYYDQASRLTSSIYGWQNVKTSLALSITKKYNEEGIKYDRNGNIQKLNRYHGDYTLVDSLSYASYNGNQLLRVDDGCTSTSPVGFKDSTSGTADYAYDANGNLTSDVNKRISGITYNYLNLPQTITIPGKGSIAYTYDAAGNKLQKTTVDQTTSPTKTTNYYYAGDFVYRNDTLELISHPEGRLRPVRIDTTQAISMANLKYIYDYFLKDHLGNTRVVITTEQETDLYAATMETAAASKEDALFSNVSGTATAKPSGFDNNSSNARTSKLNGNINVNTNKRVGPAIILKVMAGDTVSVSVSGWYTGSVQPAATGVTAIVNDLLPLLTSGIATGGGLKGGAIPASVANPILSSSLTDFLTNNQGYDNTRPKAFLNWLVVDEEFKKVESAGHAGAVQMPVIAAGTQAQTMTGPAGMLIRRNGWLYVYLSNESNQDVFFDNLVISHKRGPMLEQTDYYSFGLEIPGLSTKAAKANSYPGNRYKFTGKESQKQEFSSGDGLAEYDFGARMYDPQIGRWGVVDPLSEINRRWSPNSFGFDNPIRYIDPDGMSPQDNDTWGNFNKIANGTLGTAQDYESRFAEPDQGGNDDEKKRQKTTTDAGHGANGDVGAVDGKNYEKDYALKIEESISTWLALFGVDNNRTRTGDIKKPDKFTFRYQAANDHGSEVFLSIHLNGGTTTDNSFIAIYQQGKSNAAESIKLANLIVNMVTGIWQDGEHSIAPANRGSRFQHLAVLNNFQGQAGVLLEFGSIQSDVNRAFINQNLQKIGYMVAIGIYKYMNNGGLPTIHLKK